VIFAGWNFGIAEAGWGGFALQQINGGECILTSYWP